MLASLGDGQQWVRVGMRQLSGMLVLVFARAQLQAGLACCIYALLQVHVLLQQAFDLQGPYLQGHSTLAALLALGCSAMRTLGKMLHSSSLGAYMTTGNSDSHAPPSWAAADAGMHCRER